MVGVFARGNRNEKVVYVPIVIEQGTTWSKTLDITDTNGVDAFDWTGFLGRGQLRRSFDSADANAVSFTVTIDSDNDQMTFSLTSVQTAALDHNFKYVYDVELYNGDATPIVYRPVEGVARISPNVTKS